MVDPLLLFLFHFDPRPVRRSTTVLGLRIFNLRLFGLGLLNLSLSLDRGWLDERPSLGGKRVSGNKGKALLWMMITNSSEGVVIDAGTKSTESGMELGVSAGMSTWKS